METAQFSALNFLLDLPLLTVPGIALLYVIGGAAYRLYFSPVSKFPGPALAALTFWYEFYYDIILRGQYLFHIRALHERYGPIIRVNPSELHISDSAYYDTLFSSSASGGKRDRWAWSAKQFTLPGSLSATVKHEHHKNRRAALNRYFSTASVTRLQPLIEERVQQLIKRFRDIKDKPGEVLSTNSAFAAFTNDVVMEYAYGYSDHRIEQPNYGPDYADAARETSKAAALVRQMSWIFDLFQSLPEWLAKALSPTFTTVIQHQQAVLKKILEVLQNPRSTYQDSSHPSIFHEILESDLPESEKTATRLKDEATVLVGAGTLTTADTLAIATYNLLTSPRILAKLKTELKPLAPNPPLPTLENLPYLRAVIKEALRLSYGVSSRLQRVSPDSPLYFTDSATKTQWQIPANTPVSMTSVMVHHDEAIFPDSWSFVPERWIENPQLDRYLVSFSKGTRQCLGINLAYAELFICLSSLFKRFGSGGADGVRYEGDEGVFELYETGIEDVRIVADGFVPLAKKGSKGVRLVVKS